ncbi:MAG: flippase [Pseudomonadota bacterium]
MLIIRIINKYLQYLLSLLNHNGFKRYFTNTSWMLGENILRMIAGLFVGIYVARYLAPEKYGILSYATAFASLFKALSDLGLDSITVRELVKFPEKRDDILGTVFRLRLISGIFVLILIAVVVQLTSNNHIVNIYIFIIASGFIFQSSHVIDYYFQSKVLSKYVSICKMTQTFISSLIKLYFIFISADLFWFVIVILVDEIFLAISLCFSYWKQKVGLFFGNFSFDIAKQLLEYSWPLIFSGVTVMVYLRIDQIMIKEMLCDADVGIYSAAVRLSEVWYFFPAIITNSLFPAIINSKKNGIVFYRDRIKKLYSLLIWMAIGISLITTFFSNWIVTTLYGTAYELAGNVLKIYIWGNVFVYLSAAFGKYLINENMMKKNFYRVLAGAVTNVILNLILIKAYGIFGSAIASLISLFVANFLYDFFDKDLHDQLKLKILALINPFGVKQ